MRTGKERPSWSPPDVFKEDPEAERGFDEQLMLAAIDGHATRYGAAATLTLLSKIGKELAARWMKEQASAQTRQPEKQT